MRGQDFKNIRVYSNTDQLEKFRAKQVTVTSGQRKWIT